MVTRETRLSFLHGFKFWLCAILIFIIGVAFYIWPKEQQAENLKSEKEAYANKLKEEKTRIEALRNEKEGLARGEEYYLSKKAYEWKWKRPGEKTVENENVVSQKASAEQDTQGDEVVSAVASNGTKIRITVLIICLAFLIVTVTLFLMLMSKRTGNSGIRKEFEIINKKRSTKRIELLGTSGLLRG